MVHARRVRMDSVRGSARLYAGYQCGFNRFEWRIEHAARRLQKATVAAPRREQLAWERQHGAARLQQPGAT